MCRGLKDLRVDYVGRDIDLTIYSNTKAHYVLLTRAQGPNNPSKKGGKGVTAPGWVGLKTVD